MAVPENDRGIAGKDQPRWELISGILSAVLDLPPGDRTSFIRRECADDSALIEEITSLVLAASESEEFLETTPLRLRSACDREGERIGQWLIEEKIGEGGMGIVYRARRISQDFEQFVALKMYGRGPASNELDRRFRSELRILSLLDHPNITRLYDCGSTPDGLPYLAMELVDGLPIFEYVQTHNLSLNAKLRLFAQIVRTVHYAHQRLIVHRDIKPSNILVTATGEPKLLDFGIARILETERNTESTVTLYRAASLHYASPEQLRGGLVTIATDIYSLGILLFELVTGKRWPKPDAPNLEDLIHAIEAAPPPKAHDVLAEVDSDVDSIVAKATRPEAAARYQSADDFAADIERFLDGKPVEARRGTSLYVVRKLAARHKVVVAAATAAALATLAGLGAFAWQAKRAERERQRFEKSFAASGRMVDRLFAYYPDLDSLPGTFEVRKTMVRDMLGYLDQLAETAGENPTLLREVCEGYVRLGPLLGHPNMKNLGEPALADATLQKSLDISRRMLDRNPKDEAFMIVFGGAAQRRVTALNGLFRYAESLQLADELESRLNRMGQVPASLTRVRIFNQLMQIENRYHLGRSNIAELRAFAKLYDAGMPPLPPVPGLSEIVEFGGVRGMNSRLSTMFRGYKQYDHAERYIQANLDSLDEDSPSERLQTARRLLKGRALIRRADLRALTNRPALAEADLQESQQIFRTLTHDAPEDEQARYELSYALAELGAIRIRLNKQKEASANLIESVSLARNLNPQRFTRLAYNNGMAFTRLANLAPVAGPARCQHLRQSAHWLQRTAPVTDGVRAATQAVKQQMISCPPD